MIGLFYSDSSATVSDCGLYRYKLERQCEGLGKTAIIMVNPSTADATLNDATVRKLIGFGNRNRWGRIIIGNLFAYRSTDVRALDDCDDPIGPLNDYYLSGILGGAERVIFAWGPMSKLPKRLRARWRSVWEMDGHRAHSIGSPAKDGHPKHPLMLAYAEPIQPWSAPQ